jgi:hypothetical protein
MNAEIVVAWPPRLDDRILVERVRRVSITDSQDGVAEARILAYDFRAPGVYSTTTLREVVAQL